MAAVVRFFKVINKSQNYITKKVIAEKYSAKAALVPVICNLFEVHIWMEYLKVNTELNR